MPGAARSSAGRWPIICAPSWCWMRWKWRSASAGRTASSITATKAASIRRWHSANVAGKPVCGRRWDRSATPTTMRCARASSRPSNASCWNVAALRRRPRRRSSASPLSKAGTTRCDCILPSATARPWPTNRRWRSNQRKRNQPSSPALHENGATSRAGRIDIVVVYKVDRLTRSLADFARLVELFDAQGVSFVSVPQQFNTTTSMGRLTLNVLLSFAQFEREVTSERIRDKIAASKRKGLWVGGTLPFGYEMKDGKIAVIEEEAERVRLIYRRYLELGGGKGAGRDPQEKDIRTKERLLTTGGTRGGVLFRRGSLFYLLRNRFSSVDVQSQDE